MRLTLPAGLAEPMGSADRVTAHGGEIEDLFGNPAALCSFPSWELMLEFGDSLVVYSDGVVECRHPEGEEFGLDRLIATGQTAAGSSALMMLLAAVEELFPDER